jgi:hypothetical protein
MEDPLDMKQTGCDGMSWKVRKREDRFWSPPFIADAAQRTGKEVCCALTD